MRKDTIIINNLSIPVYSLNTVIVGTGAAGYNAADSLYQLGQKDIAIVTEGIRMGTSRNTGSDKQTYYKLSLSGNENDSTYELAKTLFDGGAKHGDIALVEAALSAKSFYKLVHIGVPFPDNEYGEYVGYKTDHDPRQRATSAGPLTSKFMVECLEKSVMLKDIPVFDKHLIIGVLINETTNESVGILTLNKLDVNTPHYGFTLFNCTNVIYATGGPSGLYEASVYPQSQTGALGVALEKGVKAVNLTESQFGIASTKFRWNLSGSYQQIIPRYISTNQEGNDEMEFINDYLTPNEMVNAIFLKGYQWPFDIKKVTNKGSSIIDLLVYQEIYLKGRRVFLDFRNNAKDFDFSLLNHEAYQYLLKSDALQTLPIERLRAMNEPAYQLYLSNGIDLETELLEINVCNQHCNGGLIHDMYWESNIKHFFPVGEAGGTFGVYRPGGSALNATQVGSFRAAHFIYLNYNEPPLKLDVFKTLISNQVKEKLLSCEKLLSNKQKSSLSEAFKRLKHRMSKYGGMIRSKEMINRVIQECKEDLDNWPTNISISSHKELSLALQYYDLLVTQLTFLSSINEYIQKTGCSRGSSLITTNDGELPLKNLDEIFRFTTRGQSFYDQLCEIKYHEKTCTFNWEKVKPIPCDDHWFETVWKKYRIREKLQ